MNDVVRNGSFGNNMANKQAFKFMGHEYFSDADSLQVMGREDAALNLVAHYGDITLRVMKYRNLLEGPKLEPNKSTVNVTVNRSRNKEVEATFMDKTLISHFWHIKNPFYNRSVNRAIIMAEKIAEELNVEKYAGSLATVHNINEKR